MLQIKIKFLRGKISPDLAADYPLWRQFVREAGLKGDLYVPASAYDKVLEAAGRHGYGFYYNANHKL